MKARTDLIHADVLDRETEALRPLEPELKYHELMEIVLDKARYEAADLPLYSVVEGFEELEVEQEPAAPVSLWQEEMERLLSFTTPEEWEELGLQDDEVAVAVWNDLQAQRTLHPWTRELLMVGRLSLRPGAFQKLADLHEVPLRTALVLTERENRYERCTISKQEYEAEFGIQGSIGQDAQPKAPANPSATASSDDDPYLDIIRRLRRLAQGAKGEDR
jgi:hypothetical protein